MADTVVTNVLKVVRRLPDGRLVSATVWGKAEVEYRVGKWVQPPDWLKAQGYGLHCFRLDAKSLLFALADAAALAETWPWGEVWLAEGRGVRQAPGPAGNPEALAKGRLVRNGKSASLPSGVVADEVRLIRRVGVCTMDVYAVACIRGGMPENVFCYDGRAGVVWNGALDLCLHAVFPKRWDAENQARRSRGTVLQAKARGVLLEPFWNQVSGGGGFSKFICGWPEGAVQALEVAVTVPPTQEKQP